ncbi:MAG: hypothetical protein ICV86_13025 [Microcoleus sp. T3-bin5]|nr:hypothetical protein [Microcoleus sp. T3-bin5]
MLQKLRNVKIEVLTDIPWLWYCTSACWQRGVRKLVCARTSHPLCFESEMNTRKGSGIT